ncbi:hypothetical protein [Pseudonocardia sp.]|uniref:hypothetical protein n=1 Tax=Pseudonocardia sp. TaxID=60912 RepID=UPI003D0D9DBD
MGLLIIWGGIVLPLAAVLIIGGAYMVRTRRLPRPQVLWRPFRGRPGTPDIRLLGWQQVSLGTGWLLLCTGQLLVATDRFPWPLPAALGVAALALFVLGFVLGRRAVATAG